MDRPRFDDISGIPSEREQQLLLKTLEQEQELAELRKQIATQKPRRPNTAPSRHQASLGAASDATVTNFVNTQQFAVMSEVPAHNTPQPPPVESHTAVGCGGKIVMFGGTNGSNISNEVWAFTLVTSNAGRRGWRRKKCDGNIPLPRCGHAAVAYKGVMYVFGGFGSTLSAPAPILLNSVYALDLSTFEWQAIVATPIDAVKNHTAEVFRDKVYIFGGVTTNGRTNRVNVFDLDALKWLAPQSYNTQLSLEESARTDVPTARSGHTSVQHGASMVVFGGRMSKTLYCNDVYRYNFDSKLWSRVYCGGTIPAPRAGHSSTVYKSSMIVFGGYNCGGTQVLGPASMMQADATPTTAAPSGRKTYFGDCHVLHLASYTWHTVVLEGPMKPLGRCGHSANLYEGANSSLHMLTYGGWGTAPRSTIDLEDDDAAAAPSPQPDGTENVMTSAETWNFVVGIVDTTTMKRKRPNPPSSRPTPAPPRPRTTMTVNGRALREPGSSPRPWSVTTSKATTAKYFGFATLPCPLQLRCQRTPREIETIVHRLGDTTRHETVMRQLESKYLHHLASDDEDGEGGGNKMSPEEMQSSIDRMFYQQVEWREEKMRQLVHKWVPEKAAKKMENNEIDDLVSRLCVLPEPDVYTPRTEQKLSKEEVDDFVNRMYYGAQEDQKRRMDMLDKKYRPESPPKKVKSTDLTGIVERLYTKGMKAASATK
eukprot:PhM_4_TR11494/c0_g1_i1/m.39575